MISFPQPQMIEKVRAMAAGDERLSAVLMYGSFIKGEGDQFSDIEFYLFFERELDHRQWVAGIRPVEMFFTNEHGTEVAVFDNLVRGEFHFLPAEEVGVVKTWAGLTSFEHADQMILVDKKGALLSVLNSISRERPRHDGAESIRWLAESLINNILMTENLIQRGENAHAQQNFQFILKYLLWLIRLAGRADNHWESPTKRLEVELTREWYEDYIACVPTAEPDVLSACYRKSLTLARRLFQDLGVPADLRRLLDRLMERMSQTG